MAAQESLSWLLQRPPSRGFRIRRRAQASSRSRDGVSRAWLGLCIFERADGSISTGRLASIYLFVRPSLLFLL
jgi:hypothetical protein